MSLNTYQLTISYTVGGQFAQNVLHYQFDDSGFSTSQVAAQALISAWDTANRSTLRNILSAAVTINSYKSSRISAAGGFEAFVPVSSSNTGTRGAALSVSGLSTVIIHYPVNLAFPRGRTFLPGVSENDVEDGVYTAAFQAAVISALNTLFDPVTLTGGGAPVATFGMFRRVPNKVFVALINSILSQNVGTMRRRMRPA